MDKKHFACKQKNQSSNLQSAPTQKAWCSFKSPLFHKLGHTGNLTLYPGRWRLQNNFKIILSYTVNEAGLGIQPEINIRCITCQPATYTLA